MGKPAATDRPRLTPLSHSFTLDLVAGFQNRADAERFLSEFRDQAGKVRSGITPGQDASDRVRAVRRPKPEATWRRKTRDLHVSGIHAFLRKSHEQRSL